MVYNTSFESLFDNNSQLFESVLISWILQLFFFIYN